jgi:hypothetical protein
MSDELKPQSIDTPEFRALAEKWQLCLTTDIPQVYAALIAHINAWGARLVESARAEGPPAFERRRNLAHAQLPLDAEVALEHAALFLSKAGEQEAHHHVTQVLAAHMPPLDGQSDTEGGAND